MSTARISNVTTTGSNNTFVVGNTVNGNAVSDLRCGCGNTGSWRDLNIGGGGMSGTCGSCGAHVTV